MWVGFVIVFIIKTLCPSLSIKHFVYIFVTNKFDGYEGKDFF